MTETETPKRKPGRPKGYPRSGGRLPGTPNKDRAATVERIQREADPLGFLCKVVRGVRMEAAAEPGATKRVWWFPTADQRITAAQTLARKVMPDQKAVEHVGELAPALTQIRRVIVEPGSVSAEVARADQAARPDRKAVLQAAKRRGNGANADQSYDRSSPDTIDAPAPQRREAPARANSSYLPMRWRVHP